MAIEKKKKTLFELTKTIYRIHSTNSLELTNFLEIYDK